MADKLEAIKQRVNDNVWITPLQARYLVRRMEAAEAVNKAWEDFDFDSDKHYSALRQAEVAWQQAKEEA